MPPRTRWENWGSGWRWGLVVLAAGCGGSGTTGPGHGISDLGVGQSVVLLDSGETTAQLSITAGAQYMVVVVNTTPSAAAIEGFTLSGMGPSVQAVAGDLGRAGARGAASPDLAPQQGGITVRIHGPVGPAPHPLDPHLAMLEHDRALVRRLIARRGNPITSAGDALRRTHVRGAARPALGVPPYVGGALPPAARVPGVISGRAGDTSLVFVRNSLTGGCASVDTVAARTVYASQRLLILEDVHSAYARTLDAFYTDTLAPEYDASTYPEVVSNFGDPLLVDDSLSAAGRVTVLFSPVLNTVLQGVAGFVNPCDFFATNSAPASSDTAVRSNQTEIFYAFVPDSGWPPDYWTLFIRSVAAHETKHVASFAQHLLDNAASFEELWLEEATAQASAEIWMRHFTPARWKTNNAFAVSVGCELITNSCGARVPFDLSQSHFVWLYDFLSAIEAESVIGATTEAKYGGAWSFARWAADQYGSSEPAFFKAIVDDPARTGLGNLSARTGQSAGSMLLDFYLATASNDFTSAFVAQDPRLTLPSWDERDIYSRLHAGIPWFFAAAYPLVPRAITSGAIGVSVPGIHGGGASIFALSASATGKQAITLESVTGAPLAPLSGLRLGVIRVE